MLSKNLSYFLKFFIGRGNTSGGAKFLIFYQITHGGKCQLSPQKIFLVPSKSFILFLTLSCQAKSVCQSVFFDQYNSLIRKTQSSHQSSVEGKTSRGGGIQIFNTKGGGVLMGGNGKFQFQVGGPDPAAHYVYLSCITITLLPISNFKDYITLS